MGSRSEAVTNGVRVEIESSYLPEESSPEHGAYVFAYEVAITNEGEQPVQLLHRHWVITNAEGKVQEVQGEGVVGEQPVIPPGETFEYTSFCPLNSPHGNMYGKYLFTTEDGTQFSADIAPIDFVRGEQWYH